jgi:hypothetical protein
MAITMSPPLTDAPLVRMGVKPVELLSVLSIRELSEGVVKRFGPEFACRAAGVDSVAHLLAAADELDGLGSQM